MEAATSSDPRGRLATALSHLNTLLTRDLVAAEAQAREILRVFPGQPQAVLALAAALRFNGRFDEALTQLMQPSQANAAAVDFERGLCFAGLKRHKDAIATFKQVVSREPNHFSAWRVLGDEYLITGNGEAADAAYLNHVNASVNDPRLIAAASALQGNNLPAAETQLRTFLKHHPTDIAAIRMLAETAARIGRYADAEKLLTRALELAPSFDAARANYAAMLQRQNKSEEALAQVEILMARDPNHAGHRNLEAAVRARLGDMDRAIAVYRDVLKDFPDQPKVWMSLGHTLKTAGNQSEAIEAYRKSVELQPDLGEAWFSLANLKTFRFTPDDITRMQAEAGRAELPPDDLWHLNFALGKAFEDLGDWRASFIHYEKANALRRATLDYDAREVSEHKNILKRVLTREFFETRRDGGCEAPDPIFVVGLPRAGSTLVEQILASHSAVEGTMELSDIFAIVGRLYEAAGKPFYPDVVAALTPEQRKVLGEEYLERTRIHRKLGRPFFIDKMPNNFLQIGFIHLVLPNAKIVDVRRHPMACGFSCFKQHFARGQGFSYSLSDIGQYYADYIELMDHYDAVLPGRVHRVHYESLVADLEGNVRALLDYCGLPFEENCLRFYQNDRIVRTASSEQVRRPIFTEGLDHWRNYERWLDPLQKALQNAP